MSEYIELSNAEKLSIVVLQYPSIYDKSSRHYKDVIVKANDWKAVAEQLEHLEDGTDAQRNLTKIYN